MEAEKFQCENKLKLHLNNSLMYLKFKDVEITNTITHLNHCPCKASCMMKLLRVNIIVHAVCLVRALTKIRLKKKEGTYKTQERVMREVSCTVPRYVTGAVWLLGRLTAAFGYG